MSVRDNFFFIDSNHLENVSSRLYGFCIADTAGQGIDDIMADQVFYQKTCNGCFVLVQDTERYIYISQDFIGSYGLYVFRRDDYFAVSNSFLFLLENIEKAFPVTANKDYMKYFLLCGLCYAYKETPVNEVEMLSRHVSVIIDKERKTLELYKKVAEDETLEPDSAEGMAALDNWYYSWTNFIRNLCAKTDKVSVDLSGGMDSRLTFMLFLCAGVDFNKIRVNSTQDDLATHSEDLEIAQMIAEKYGFVLNKRIPIEYIAFSQRDTIELSFYVKLGFHKEMYFKRSYCEETVFAFSGGGGETHRDYNCHSVEKFIGKLCARQEAVGLECDFSDGIKSVVQHAKEGINDVYGSFEGKEFGHYLGREGMTRHHFGKSMVEQYLDNRIRISPLLDFNLHKLRYSAKDSNLITALLYTRYCPELLEFKFDSGRSIDEKALKEAARINAKYPFRDSAKDREKFSGMNIHYIYRPFAEPAVKDGTNRPDEWCKKVFYSDFVKRNFCHAFPERLYDYADDFSKAQRYQPLREMCADIAIAKVIHAAGTGQSTETVGIYDFFEKMT